MIVLIVVALLLTTGNALAESIKERLGITGQLGFVMPNNSKFTDNFVSTNGLSSNTLKADGAFVGGGGLIFGLTDNWAVEANALYMPQNDYNGSNGTKLTIKSTDVSGGIQYRNNVSNDFAAYLGAGVDVLLSDGDIDTVVGGHINAGGDYFLTKYLALNIEMRGIFFPEADVKNGGVTVVKYDPTGYMGLVGVRFFLY
jgi:outer membrane protein